MMIPLSIVTQAHNAGLCVIPPAMDGTKKPLPPGRDPRWRNYQTQRPDLAVLHSWYDPRNGLTGLGIVTGTVSSTHLRSHETDSYPVCRPLLEKKKQIT